MAYTKTSWVDGGAPAITAAKLNNLETQYDEVFNTIAAFGHYHSNFTNNASVSASTDTVLMPNATTGSPLVDVSGNIVIPSDGVYAFVLSVALSGVAASTRIDLRMFKGTVAGGPGSLTLFQILNQHINPTASASPIVLGVTIPKLTKNDLIAFYINPSTSVTVVGGISRLNIIKLT
jgi:hypothetical protein